MKIMHTCTNRSVVTVASKHINIVNDIHCILVGWNCKIWIQDYLIVVIDKLMVNSLSQQIFGLISQNLD